MLLDNMDVKFVLHTSRSNLPVSISSEFSEIGLASSNSNVDKCSKTSSNKILSQGNKTKEKPIREAKEVELLSKDCS
jgi:hypothetical protein